MQFLFFIIFFNFLLLKGDRGQKGDSGPMGLPGPMVSRAIRIIYRDKLITYFFSQGFRGAGFDS